MKPTDDMKKLFKNAAISTNPKADEMVFDKVLTAQEKALKAKSALAWPKIRRTIMKSRITKLAALAAIIVLVSIIISYIAKDHPGGIAFADVVKTMQEIKTVTWTSSAEVSPPEDENTIQVSSGHICRKAYKTPGHERREVTQKLIHPETKQIYEHKHVEIVDRNAGKFLSLNPQEMTAYVSSFEPLGGEDPFVDVFLNPKNNIPPSAESLGTKPIDGRETVGFRMKKTGDDTYIWTGKSAEVWVDVETKRVALVETTGANGRVVYRLKDFVFDQELDDSLFSLEPPQGYRYIKPPEILSIESSEDE
ncbi:MAG: LolA family protein [Planctomycetota bacterium]|jgi:outer membrane lipoprotein-sorting protein